MNDFDKELIYKYVSKDKWKESLEKLKAGYPVQYIIGNVNFYGYDIEVNENVLIPRFETEGLVEKTIKYTKFNNIETPKILDIGCGSGCISIALKKEIPCEVTCIDINPEAVNITKKNALMNEVMINVINSDIESFSTTEKYDIIISNPPYISVNEQVDPKTKFEPQNALFAPNEGLYYYEEILKKAQKLLKKNGLLAFEIGAGQREPIFKLIEEKFPLSEKVCEKDLSGLDRYIFVFLNK